MNLSELLNQNRDQILDVVQKHGGQNVRIFGSVARGETGPDSDVDFLIDLERGRSLLDRASIKLELEKVLGCKVDVVTERGLRDRMRPRVLQEAVPL